MAAGKREAREEEHRRYEHSLRLALSVVPSVAYALSLAGSTAQVAVLAGAAVAIVVRVAKQPGTFVALTAVWAGFATASLVGLVSVSGSVYSDQWVTYAAAVLSLMITFASASLLLSLQFDAVLKCTPLAEIFERLAFAITLPAGICSLGLAASDLYGSQQLPLALVPITALHQHLFSHPQGIPSGVPAATLPASDKFSYRPAQLLTVALPTASYIAVQSLSGYAPRLLSQSFMLALLFGAGIMLSLPLDWLKKRQIGGIGKENGTSALSVFAAFLVAAGVQGAVIDPVLSPYMMPLFEIEAPTLGRILLALPAMTAALLPLLKALHERTTMAQEVDVQRFASSLVGMSTGFFSAVLGAPLPVTLSLMLAVQGAVLFFLRDERPNMYLALQMCFFLMLFTGWFLYAHFWYLDAKVGGIKLNVLCMLLLCCSTVAVLIPAIIAAQRKERMYINSAGMLLLIHSVLLTCCETFLRQDGEGELLSPTACAVSTVIGCFIAHRLAVCGRVHHNAAWLTSCVLCGKLAMLLEASLPMVVSSVLLVTAASGRAIGVGAAHASALLVPFGIPALQTLLGLSPPVVLGALLSILSVGVSLPKRIAMPIASLGSALIAIQPSLRFRKSTIMPGEGLDAWLLVGSLTLFAYSAASPRSSAPRLVQMAFLVGFSFTAYLLPVTHVGFGSLMCVLSVSCGSAYCAALLQGATKASLAKSLGGLTVSPSIFTLLFTIEYLLSERRRVYRGYFEHLVGVSDSQTSIEAMIGLHAAILALGALCSRLRIEHIVGQEMSAVSRRMKDTGSEFEPFKVAMPFQNAQVSGIERRLERNGLSWLPTLGYTLAVTAYVMLQSLNHKLANGSATGAVLVSAVLLLKPPAIKVQGYKRFPSRYRLPVVLLLVHCLLMLLEDQLDANEDALVQSESKLWAQRRDLFGLLLALPAAVFALNELGGQQISRYLAGAVCLPCFAPLAFCHSAHTFTFVFTVCSVNVLHIALQSRRMQEADEKL